MANGEIKIFFLDLSFQNLHSGDHYLFKQKSYIGGFSLKVIFSDLKARCSSHI